LCTSALVGTVGAVEAFENFSDSWKARARYEFLSDNEFIETFELAAPGKPFQVYSYNRFKRVQK
jgi:lipopolysaccharide assembly outer membrane protein LptD (OstA)